MRSYVLGGLVLVLLNLSGCASITGDTVQAVRIETRLADGSEVRDVECELSNEYGAYTVKSPGSVTIRRSSTDLTVTCKKPGQPEARGSAISRANKGMWGNILFGGGVGAIIDHNRGTAYTYPEWLQMVFGKLLIFDRGDDTDGKPSLARDVGAKPVAGDGKTPTAQEKTPVSANQPESSPL